MCPHSGFRSGGTCERTLVPVFVPGEHPNVTGEHPNVPSFRFSFWGNIRQNHPFGKPPFWKTTLLSTPEKWTGDGPNTVSESTVSSTELSEFLRPRRLSAPKWQRSLRFAIAMPIADPRNRSDFRDKRKQCGIEI